MKARLLGVAALLCFSVTAAEAVTWRFDFTSPRGGGFFEVDGSSFAIPLSAGSPTSFNITAADININAGGVLGSVEYKIDNVFETNCTPGECRATFSIAPFIVPQVATYTALYLQLNFAEIWLPWVTNDQQTIQLWLHTDPYAQSLAWNDSGQVQRTVIDPTPLPAALPLFATGLGALGLLGWRRKRKAKAAA
jgi:hypothetical protein